MQGGPEKQLKNILPYSALIPKLHAELCYEETRIFPFTPQRLLYSKE